MKFPFMKTSTIALAFVIAAATMAQARNASVRGSYGTVSNPNSHYVPAYTNSTGTTVREHYQTNPNTTQRDNYSARGNVNPYTGVVGTRSPQY